ncbi:MAG: 30S ribosomal protein S4 [Candidatus Magasanikbacteria bacterium CG10_big_fil_rev_8_21_14_0_10_40_10]|uniref:Small ribosomal subunit protein uS4 n=1 Tax=Candidatus Magasanikbacteria bacterium CG10_big_fil_rev_8_21_14_0_10_40_10 TaxID=1974648 RepID=A0A2M6W4U9_9BACT|nr:MAG: 30S ribosomal protein S4 [Candidatus Magasanikbacteria bacterium CG10_big_fil_rev_8_21_14_0_10_40_10]
MESNQKNQCTHCRRVGTKLFLKGEKCQGPKCLLIKRNFPSGVHGLKKKRAKKSIYGRQLVEKQKAKEIYGLRDKQLFNYLKEASQKQGNSGDFLLRFLESRLDNTVFRMGLASSRAAARQMVNHGHIQVNGKKVDIPSFRVKVGQVIGVAKKSQTKPLFSKSVETMTKAEPVSWVGVMPDKLEAKILNEPTLDNCGFEVNAIVEFYSRKL